MAPIIRNVKGGAARLFSREERIANQTLRNAAKKESRKANKRAKLEQKLAIVEAEASTLPPKPLTDQVSGPSDSVCHPKDVRRWKEATKAAALASLSPTGRFTLRRDLNVYPHCPTI